MRSSRWISMDLRWEGDPPAADVQSAQDLCHWPLSDLIWEVQWCNPPQSTPVPALLPCLPGGIALDAPRIRGSTSAHAPGSAGKVAERLERYPACQSVGGTKLSAGPGPVFRRRLPQPAVFLKRRRVEGPDYLRGNYSSPWLPLPGGMQRRPETDPARYLLTWLGPILQATRLRLRSIFRPLHPGHVPVRPHARGCARPP